LEDESKAEAYLKEQQKVLKSHVIGQKDNSGNIIKKINARGEEYIIYEIEGESEIDSLKIILHTKIEEDTEPIDNFQKVKDNFDRLKSVLSKTKVDSSYKQRMASALVVGITGHIEESKTLFKNIENDALDDYKHKIYGRLFYLFGSIITTFIVSLIALITYINRNTDFFAGNHDLTILIYSVAFASLGGFFSVSLKAKEVFTLRAISYWMYIVYGAERLFISVIAGIATYTLISSGLILSILNPDGNNIYSLLSICFISGFSETLIPNTLNKVEHNIKKDSNKS